MLAQDTPLKNRLESVYAYENESIFELNNQEWSDDFGHLSIVNFHVYENLG